MSSSSAYSLEIPSVRQWKAKSSFPYADPPGLVARGQGACAFPIWWTFFTMKEVLKYVCFFSHLKSK
ncbi:hypothetical protein [Alteribacillus sp. YIM 98480]|uniref:hypothetical protein n=1 Tax=Alteribacillus sp. YIM 98480 TaxID=2606599 RepID=UPI00131B4DB1|nr:hypothetical protein [Alteribacillus sp. YIM 98480]